VRLAGFPMSAVTEPFHAYSRDRYTHRIQIEAAVAYDFPALADQHLGFVEPGERPDVMEQAHEVCVKAAAASLNELIMFCFKGQPLNARGAMRLVARRFLAIAHHVNGSELRGPLRVPTRSGFVERAGPPMSLAALAKYLGTTPYKLRNEWADFRQRWSFTARVAERPRKQLTRSK
jgi:hypothetical protein